MREGSDFEGVLRKEAVGLTGVDVKTSSCVGFGSGSKGLLDKEEVAEVERGTADGGEFVFAVTFEECCGSLLRYVFV